MTVEALRQVSHAITNPAFLRSRAEVLAKPSPVPTAPGVYGWFFRESPPGINPAACIEFDGLRLLYVGIAPKKPPANGKSPSEQTLRTRIRYHYRGNAYGSTLRLSLGCLLSKQLDITLWRVGSGHRLTFAPPGETRLSEWMAENALVTWVECAEPWDVEDYLVAHLDLPLNIHGNKKHPFCATLQAARAEAKATALAGAIYAA